MTNELKKEIGKDFQADLTKLIDYIDEAMGDIRFHVRYLISVKDGLEKETYDKICDLFADLMETRNDAVRARRSVYETCIGEDK